MARQHFRTIAVLCALACLALLLSALYYSAHSESPREKYIWESRDGYVRDELLYCISNTRVLWRSACFNDLAQSLLKQFSLEETLASLARLDQEDSIRQTCHALVHNLGQETYRATQSLPQTFLRCSSQIACGEGCFHGAVEAYVNERGAGISSTQIEGACAQLPGESAVTIDACHHGLGHAFMLATGNDVPRSLAKCDVLTDADARTTCLDGVFMENVFAVGGAGRTTDYFHPDDPAYPCTILPEQYRDSCYGAASSQIIQATYADYVEVAQWCTAVPERFQPSCYGSIGGDAVLQFSDPTAIVETCGLVPQGKNRDSCLWSALKFRLYGDAGNFDGARAICASTRVSDTPACNAALSQFEVAWQKVSSP